MRRLTVLLILLVACGGGSDSTAPVVLSVVGSYTLTTVNGSALPAILSQSGTTKIEILDDLFTLNADHTYSEVGHIRTTSGATVATTAVADVGTYNSTNGAVSMVSTVGNGPSTGSVNGSNFTVLASGVTAVYHKN